MLLLLRPSYSSFEEPSEPDIPGGLEGGGGGSVGGGYTPRVPSIAFVDVELPTTRQDESRKARIKTREAVEEIVTGKPKKQAKQEPSIVLPGEAQEVYVEPEVLETLGLELDEFLLLMLAIEE